MVRSLYILNEPTIQAVPLLGEEHRAAAGQLDGQRGDQEHRRKHDETGRGPDHVDAPLGQRRQPSGARGDATTETRSSSTSLTQSPVSNRSARYFARTPTRSQALHDTLDLRIAGLDGQRDEHLVNRVAHQDLLQILQARRG